MAYLFTDVDHHRSGLQAITAIPRRSGSGLGETQETQCPLGAVSLTEPTRPPVVIAAYLGLVGSLQAMATFGLVCILSAVLLLASPSAHAQQLIPNPDAGSGYVGSPIVFNNALYEQYTDEYGTFVLAKYDGTSSTIIENPDGGRGYVGNPIVFNNALYGRYQNQSFKFVLAKYDGTNLTAIPNPDGGSGYYGDPILFNDVIYGVYQNASGNRVLAKYDGTSWTTIPNPDAGGGYRGAPIIFNNALYGLYFNASSQYVLAKYDGTSSTIFTNPDAGGGYKGYPIVFNNTLYGQYSDANGKDVLVKYDGTGWMIIANPDAGGGYKGSPIVFKNALYGQYLNASGKNVLAKYDGANWTLIANPDAEGDYVGSPIVFNNALYGKYQNASLKGILAKYDGTSWTVFANPDNGSYGGFPIMFNNALYGRYSNASHKTVLAILSNFLVSCSLTVNATPASQTITSGQSATLTASGATSYTWSNGSTANPLILTNVTTATTLSVTGVTGACSATASATVSVTAAPTPAITAGTATGTITACAGTASVSTQTFTTSGTSLTANIVATAPAGFEISTSAGSGFGTSLTLMQSGGKVSNTTIYVRSSATATTGSISGNVVLTSSGATTQNVSVSGTINPLPVASILPTSVTLTCTSPTVSLTASGGSTYVWDDSSTSLVRTVSMAGPYSVTVTSANGCSAVASTSVSQDNTVPTATITGTLTVVSGGTTTLTASGGGSYRWSTGQITVSITATAGPYSLTVTNANGCFATATATVTTVDSPANTAPTVVNAVGPQSATVGVGYTLSLANVFTDAETPNQLTLSVSGLPAGLNFTAPATISGTPSMSGVSMVTVTATDPGSLSASTSFDLTVSPASGTPPPPPSGTFSITGVTTVSCQVISAGARQLTFNPRYAGLDGSPVSFSVANEMLPTTAPGPYSLRVYTDNSTITLQARQGASTTSFVYNWLNVCSGNPPTNTAPTVVNAVGPQSATVGVGYTLSLANVFTDAETPNQLTLSVSGLPAGLNFTAPATISGTPSMGGVSMVTVTATDPGSLSASTSFDLTVSPASGTPLPPPSGTFSLTGVTTVSCQVLSAGERQVTFNPRYAGLDGSPVSFSVANEMLPTTAPGPYSLHLYTDNPVITLQAKQGSNTSSFSYNWLAACTTPPSGNTPPTVANEVGPQSATVGVGYTLSLANVFTDAETPNQLTLSVSGLPPGVSFTPPSIISGTPSMSGVSTVTVVATDPGSLTASTNFNLTVSPASGTPPPPSGTFSLTGVTTVSCQVLSAGARQLTFNPQYGGVDGSPISFSVANEMLPTTAPGPYSLHLYTDNPVITLQAKQGSSTSSFTYNWLAACSSAGSRLAAGNELTNHLRATVFPNPVGEEFKVRIEGAQGQRVQLELLDLSGHSVLTTSVEVTTPQHEAQLRFNQQGIGLYLLRVSADQQAVFLKVIKQ